MLQNDVKYYVVKERQEYGHILNNVFYEYAFGTELPIKIEDGQIIQSISTDKINFKPEVIATIEGNTVTNKHGAVFQLKTEKP